MLTVKNLNLDSRHKNLVHNVSFSLENGQSLALMGASGTGKSLMALACMDLLPPNIQKTTGEITHGTIKPAFVMQNPADCFDPLFNIRSVFTETFGKQTQALAQELNIEDPQTLLEMLLVKVGFARPQEIWSKFPFELSGGMLHRVMLAVALGAVIIGKADCIIADEPLAGLDTPSKLHMLELLRTIQQEHGFSLLYIDHDLNAAHRVADKLMVMHEGSIVEEGDFTKLINAPTHPATQNLVQAFTRLSTIHIKQAQPRENAAPILTLKNVSKTYDEHMAVRNVSLNLYKGQSLGLIGKNGAGKSTLIRLILGLEQSDDGEIHCFGHRVQKTFKNVPWRKDLQAMFQHARLAVNPRMQVQDIILEPLRAQKFFSSKYAKQEHLRILKELLDMVELPHSFALKYPMNMSGGQLQRVCLARALALKPQILLLDEPLADLDASIAEHLQIKLLEIQRILDLSYIYISHDITSVLRMCDGVCVLHDGQVVDNFFSTDYADPNRHPAFKTLKMSSK